MFFLLAPDKIRERFGTTALINGATIRLTAMSCGCIGLLKSLPAILPGASPVITCGPAIEDIPRASMCSLYRLAAGHVVVMRVLHQSMDFARHCTPRPHPIIASPAVTIIRITSVVPVTVATCRQPAAAYAMVRAGIRIGRSRSRCRSMPHVSIDQRADGRYQ